jgi:hypothetical protein
MQAKINKVKATVSQKLKKLKIKFDFSDMEILNEDETVKVLGCKVSTDKLTACIIPNFRKNRVEFLLLNENMIEHLVSEGMSDDEIMKNGKVWTHITSTKSFIDIMSYCNE